MACKQTFTTAARDKYCASMCLVAILNKVRQILTAVQFKIVLNLSHAKQNIKQQSTLRLTTE